jgi:hypothetical protein
MVYRTYLGRAGIAGLLGLAFIGLWFALSMYDWVTRHRWLDWLYSDEHPPINESTSEDG